VLRTKVEKPKQEQADEEAAAAVDEETNAKSYLILAKQSGNFAISDLGSLFFSGYEGEEDSENVKGYIYTDRPVYRHTHKVSFKGIVRAIDPSGVYKAVGDSTINVTVADPNGANIFTKELPLSARGTFNGDLELSESAPLG